MLVETSADIRKELLQIQERLKKAVRSEKIESLKSDIRVLDWIDEVKKHFDESDFESARKVSAQLYRALNAESVSLYTTDFSRHFEKYRSQGETIKMPPEWGFYKKNEIELERGLTYSIGARPGTGKSTAGCNLAYYYAYELETPFKVLFLTNEMKEGQIWIKLYQIHLNKTEGKALPFMLVKDWLRYPKQYPSQFAKITEFAKKISENLKIANVRKRNADEICIAIDEAKNEFMQNADIVMLDYLQRVPRAGTDERLSIVDTVQKFSEKMADLDAVMFIFSQMNKDGGFKGSEAPQEEAGIGWELSRETGRDGKFLPFLKWKIVKSRISAYITVLPHFDDRSGTILNDHVSEPPEEMENPFENTF